MGLLIDNFDGWWQNRQRQGLVPDKALYKVTDAASDELGAVTCRRLHTTNARFSGVSSGSVIKNIYQLDVEGRAKRLVFHTEGTSLHVWNSSTGISRTLSSAMSGGHVSYAAMKPVLSTLTYVYVTDGTVALCDNGTTSKTWGIDGPTRVPTATIDPDFTGNLSAGDYRYAFSFYDKSTGSESVLSPATAALTVAASKAVLVTDIAVSSNPRVTSRRVYRTIADGGSYYLLRTLDDNTTTSLLDTVADDNLTSLATLDQDIPPEGDLVMTYGDHLLMAGDLNNPNRLSFNIANYPDQFPSTYYVSVGSADDKIQNMFIHEGAAYLLLTAGIARLYGSDPDTFVTAATRSHLGTYARWSQAVGPDGVYFLAYDGVYRFDGVKSVRVSDKINKIFGLTPGDWFDVVDRSTAGDVARSAFLQGKYYLVVPMKTATGSVTKRLLVYDTLTVMWDLYSVEADDVFADEGRGELYGGMKDADDDTKYTVYNLMAADASTIDTPEVDVVTKAYDMRDIGEFPQKDVLKPRQKNVGWLRKYRVDAIGSWTFGFYVDGKLRFSATLSGLTEADKNTWRDFSSAIKGREVYIRITSSGSPQPTTHILNEIELI